MSADTIACHGCGRREHAELIDAKPQPGTDPETSDWTRLECVACYGPGWEPVGEGSLDLSVRPDLKPYYDQWKREHAPGSVL